MQTLITRALLFTVTKYVKCNGTKYSRFITKNLLRKFTSLEIKFFWHISTSFTKILSFTFNNLCRCFENKVSKGSKWDQYPSSFHLKVLVEESNVWYSLQTLQMEKKNYWHFLLKSVWRCRIQCTAFDLLTTLIDFLQQWLVPHTSYFYQMNTFTDFSFFSLIGCGHTLYFPKTKN